MWGSVSALLGTIALSACQPSLDTVVTVSAISAGKYRVHLELPSWKDLADPQRDTLLKRDMPLAERHAASVCANGYQIELEELRAGMLCDFECVEGQPAFQSSTTWLVTCEDAAQ